MGHRFAHDGRAPWRWARLAKVAAVGAPVVPRPGGARRAAEFYAENNNPAGAADAIVRFGMTNASNDWWWALDNIVVTTDPVHEPAAASLLALAALAALRWKRD